VAAAVALLLALAGGTQVGAGSGCAVRGQGGVSKPVYCTISCIYTEESWVACQ